MTSWQAILSVCVTLFVATGAYQYGRSVGFKRGAKLGHALAMSQMRTGQAVPGVADTVNECWQATGTQDPTSTARLNAAVAKLAAAELTLNTIGYTYTEGAELWSPPAREHTP